MKSKFVISRPVNGISINGLEYLLGSNNLPLDFKTEEDAKEFLKQSGLSISDIDRLNINIKEVQ